MGEVLREWWHALVALTAIGVYLLRLEAKTLLQGAEISRLWRQRDEDQASARQSRVEVHEKLDEVNAKLDRLIERLMR